MVVVNYIVLTLLLCLAPAGVVWLCRRFPLLDKLGPIMVLYGVGIIIGNLPFVPKEIGVLQDILPNATIPLAIPMMLFGCVFSRREAGLQAKLLFSGFFSVCIAIIGGYIIFGHNLKEGAEIGGIITGMYTGGTLNAAALQAIFRIESSTYVLINSYDIIISFLYFVFLFTVGIRLFRWLYRSKQQGVGDVVDVEAEKQRLNLSQGASSKISVAELAKIVGATLVVVALSGGVALCLPDAWFMVTFILMLTTLGVAASFIKPIRNLTHSYDVGMYLIYIFSITIATMADFSSLDLVGGASQMAFMSFAVFVSLLLHAIFCRLLRVDADSMVISSVAFINSPPFVPMVSAAMRNRKTLVTGLAAGVAGYAIGNHLGVIMAELLSRL